MARMKNLARSAALWENDGAGGGGGDGGDKPAFSDDQKAELSTMINAANSTHSTRMSKAFDQKLEDLGQGINSKFDALMAKVGGDNGGDGKGKAPPKDESEAMATMRRENEARHAESERRFQKQEEQRLAVESKSRTTEERSALKAALSANEVPSGLLAGAEAVLYASEGSRRIGRTKDTNKIHFTFQRDGYVDKIEDMNVAVKEWLATDEGKFYAKPRNVQGSGNQGNRNAGQGSGSGGSSQSKGEQKRHGKHDLMRAIVTDGSF